MGIEIERKFLLRGADWRAQARDRTRMVQGYLGGEHCSVRVRIEDAAASLNVKSRELGARRLEFEYPLPLADAEDMLRRFCPQRVEKWRHRIVAGTHVWEIDEFLGENAGLLVAEIELRAEDEPFERPPWLGDEVTGQARYYNLNLATTPYARWPDKDVLASGE